MFTIYTKEACNYCNMAKAEMDRLGIKYEIVEQSEQSSLELSSRLDSNMFLYPQIFDHNGSLIGGFEALLDYTDIEPAPI
jgi:glutaredoxin